MLTEQQKLIKYNKSIILCKLLAIIDRLNNKVLGELSQYQIIDLKLGLLDSIEMNGEEKTVNLFYKRVYDRVNDLELDAERIFQIKLKEMVGG